MKTSKSRKTLMSNNYMLGTEITTPCLKSNVPSFKQQLGWVPSFLLKDVAAQLSTRKGVPFQSHKEELK